MFFLPISCLLLLIFAIFPFLFFLPIAIIQTAFVKLGLSPEAGFLIFMLSLLGSTINIPLNKRTRVRFYWGIPEVEEFIISINVGGAIIPIALVIYLLLLPDTPIISVVITTLIMIIICKLLAKPVRGLGIALPAFIPPLLSAVLAMIFAYYNPPRVAYISGVLGTLIGADILNLHKVERIGGNMLSIGGAGVFDGIYLTGLVACLLAFKP